MFNSEVAKMNFLFINFSSWIEELSRKLEKIHRKIGNQKKIKIDIKIIPIRMSI